MEKCIETPKIINPVNGAIRFVGPFQASEYVRVGRFKLTHEYSEWQLSNDTKFINVFLTGKSEKVLKAWVPDLSAYQKQRMYVRVRYGANGIWSDWSEPVVFTTK